jgi:hypothetical protein
MRLTLEEKMDHLLTWAAEWHESERGRSMWAYSLSIGGSHALLNGWMKNEKLMSMLTQEEKGLIKAARSRALRYRSARYQSTHLR